MNCPLCGSLEPCDHMVERLEVALENAVATGPYDRGRNNTHPCTFCGCTPEQREVTAFSLVDIGIYKNGGILTRPVCATCCALSGYRWRATDEQRKQINPMTDPKQKSSRTAELAAIVHGGINAHRSLVVSVEEDQLLVEGAAARGQGRDALRELAVYAERFGWPQQLATETLEQYIARREAELTAVEERVYQEREMLRARTI